jgi:hypothetical protein
MPTRSLDPSQATLHRRPANPVRALALLLAGAAFGWSSGAKAEAYPPQDKHLPPMVLESEGIFWAGGQVVNRTEPGLENNKIYVGKAYVEYFIPLKKRAAKGTVVPIVMTHSSISGAIWRTTPDGREGWAQWFVRRGFPFYVHRPARKGACRLRSRPGESCRARKDPTLCHGTAHGNFR